MAHTIQPPLQTYAYTPTTTHTLPNSTYQRLIPLIPKVSYASEAYPVPFCFHGVSCPCILTHTPTHIHHRTHREAQACRTTRSILYATYILTCIDAEPQLHSSQSSSSNTVDHINMNIDKCGEYYIIQSTYSHKYFYIHINIRTEHTHTDINANTHRRITTYRSHAAERQPVACHDPQLYHSRNTYTQTIQHSAKYVMQ